MELSKLEFYLPIRVITAAGANEYTGIRTVAALREHIHAMAVKHGWARIEVRVGRDYYHAEIKTTSELAFFESEVSQCFGFAVIPAESPDVGPTVEYVALTEQDDQSHTEQMDTEQMDQSHDIFNRLLTSEDLS